MCRRQIRTASYVRKLDKGRCPSGRFIGSLCTSGEHPRVHLGRSIGPSVSQGFGTSGIGFQGGCCKSLSWNAKEPHNRLKMLGFVPVGVYIFDFLQQPHMYESVSDRLWFFFRSCLERPKLVLQPLHLLLQLRQQILLNRVLCSRPCALELVQ